MSENVCVMIDRISSDSSSLLNSLAAPTSSLSSALGSTALSVYVPKARKRIGPNSGSRSMTGFGVPHFKSVICFVLTKYTSDLNGLLKPYFQPCSVLSSGRLSALSS